MTDVSVVIPWRNDHGQRERILDWNLRRWRLLLPDAEIGTWGHVGDPFNRSRARNEAVANSVGDILVVADADTAMPRRLNLVIAIEWVRQTGQWCLPYDIYFNLSQEDTERVLASPPDAELGVPDAWEFRLTDAVSGVIVLPRSSFDLVGGYDESFEGWGFEDRAFVLALETLCGPGKRLPNHLLHLWHPVGPTDAFGNPAIHENQKRWLQYVKAAGNQRSMSELVAR